MNTLSQLKMIFFDRIFLMKYSTPTNTGHIGPALIVTPLSLRHLIQLTIYINNNKKVKAPPICEFDIMFIEIFNL